MAKRSIEQTGESSELRPCGKGSLLGRARARSRKYRTDDPDYKEMSLERLVSEDKTRLEISKEVRGGIYCVVVVGHRLRGSAARCPA